MPLSAVVPQEEQSLLSIEHGWHLDLLNFVRSGIPKIVVALLIAFVAQRLVLGFTNRPGHRHGNAGA